MDWVEGIEQAGVTMEVYDHPEGDIISRIEVAESTAALVMFAHEGQTFEHDGVRYCVFSRAEDSTPIKHTTVIGVTVVTRAPQSLKA